MTRDEALQAWRAMSLDDAFVAVCRDVLGKEPWFVRGGIQNHFFAYAVEEKIAEMGLQSEYLTMLLRLTIEASKVGYVGYMRYWELLHASPAQRCCAAWVTCKMRKQP